MFNNLEPLNISKHRNLLFKPVANYAFAANICSAPISITEIIETAKYFPITFSLEGALLPIALLALPSLKDKPRNAFLNGEGKWLTPYVPAHVRRYPFIFSPTNEAGKYIVMADMSAPQLGTKDGEPLYTAKGDNNPVLQKAIEFITLFQNELEATERLLLPLLETDILTTKPIEIIKPNGEKTHINGIRTVEQKKLMALDDATLATWVRSGLMGAIYAQAASLKNLTLLAELQHIRTEEKATPLAPDPF